MIASLIVLDGHKCFDNYLLDSLVGHTVPYINTKL